MNYSQALTTDQIRQQAPSAFAIEPYHGQSNRYAFIPTSSVIDGMHQAGFVPVQASQSRTRIADKQEFTKHMIRFRAAMSLRNPAIVGDSILEAVLINSHDGSSAYKLMAGVFRFVCSNGMVVADSLLASINIRHTGRVIEDVIEGSQHIFENAPKVMKAVSDWQQIELAPVEQKVFAESAHALRFADAEAKAAVSITPEMLLVSRRPDDRGNDLWRTFNRIQENTTKGVKHYAPTGRVSSRAIKGIDGDVKLNRALWSLAEKMAEIKRAA